MRRRIASAVVLCMLLAASGFGLRSTDREVRTTNPIAEPATLQHSGRVDLPAVISDLEDIRFQREFRILVSPPDNGTQGDPGAVRQRVAQARLMEKFADEQFLIPVWVPVEHSDGLTHALMRGLGDVVATPLPLDRYRDSSLRATVPVDTRHEIMVAREGEHIVSEKDLAGRVIAVRARSGFWPQLAPMLSRVPGLEAHIVDERVSNIEVARQVRGAQLDLAMLEMDPLSIGSGPLSQLKVVESFSVSTNLGYGVHPDAKALHLALDEFLARERLAARDHARYRASWSQIKRRGLLRVITRNNAATFFIWRGRPVGFEYELMAKFARKHELSLQMVVPNARDQLFPALEDGYGDVIAASLAITDRRRQRGLAFTRAYKRAQENFVTRVGDPPIRAFEDLKGRTVTVRRSSIAWEELDALRRAGYPFTLVAGPEQLETEDYIERVGTGSLDVTVADSYSVKVALAWRNDIISSMSLGGPVDVGWAVRQDNTELLARLNTFIEEEYRNVEYNILHKRYFSNQRRVRAHVTQRADGINGGTLSPYDELVQLHAARYGFDWPLIVAQMFRESRFNPKVTSLAGAQGLMQVLPVTARRFGISNLKEPENSIAAGVRMMSWLHRRMDSTLPVRERIWFTLAAYNAGLGHLIDARRLALELGLDRDKWFDNVEKAMLLLSKPEYYRKARHGYVRGHEPVAYVRDIRDLYDAYRSLLRS